MGILTGLLATILVFFSIWRLDHHIDSRLALLESPGTPLYSDTYLVSPGEKIPLWLLHTWYAPSEEGPARFPWKKHTLVLRGLPGPDPVPKASGAFNATSYYRLVFDHRNQTLLGIFPEGVSPDGPPPSLPGLWLPPVFMGTLVQTVVGDFRPVALGETSKKLRTTILTSEDRRFYDHPAIDFEGILRAAWADLRSKSFREGGSTISQQVVKNLFLSPRKTFSRKIMEAIYAWRLTRLRTPDEILSLYLNHLDFGSGAHSRIIGIEAASERFFGHPAKTLNFRESALLAAVLRAPSRNNPFRDPDQARTVRNRILTSLYQAGKLSSRQYARDRRSSLGLSSLAYRTSRPGPYFSDWIAHEIRNHPVRDKNGSSFVFTTLDPYLAHRSEKIVTEELLRLARTWRLSFRPHDGEGLQAAVIDMDPRTGSVKTLIGGSDYGPSPFNRAIFAKRQVASLFKIVASIVALTPSGGQKPPYTLATPLSNAPIRLRAGGRIWKPKNAEKVLEDQVLFQDAFVHSMNIPFLHLSETLSPQEVVDTARMLGLETPPAARLPLSWPLGVLPQTPMAMARVFSIVANGGRDVQPEGLPDPGRKPGRRLLDPGVDYLLNHLLRLTVREGTGAPLQFWTGPQTFWGGKTGTSNRGRDTWFVAVSPQNVLVVWIGFDDNTPTRRTGSQMAVPLAGAILRNLPPPPPPGPPPPGIETKTVDARSGLLALASCSPDLKVIPFLSRTAPPAETCLSPSPPSIFERIGHFFGNLF
ncbi:transglycosylase domain-containing protein [Leptospirillum ferriphilum]|jgi:penicillin-binding protein 1B|uniref:Membrane carboxypeptidase n=1 Tax=Leptospirillum ferriphilum (strain ML-04) TaxID=1048260 RepID=J9ZCU7_LEPFM|nr:transglycosylase domain-containing protein [Leptospirillum ferriphilum]AFS54460.1 membrane carboxypeptidase [Leptospirillum ferriphilum ML-04]EAY58262.1 MAG: Peptidoglycan glycosyltransferase [Leptospirillum rubarum]